MCDRPYDLIGAWLKLPSRRRSKHLGPFAELDHQGDRDRRLGRGKTRHVLLDPILKDSKILFLEARNYLTGFFVEDDRVNIDYLGFDLFDRGVDDGILFFFSPFFFFGGLFTFFLGLGGRAAILFLSSRWSRFGFLRF